MATKKSYTDPLDDLLDKLNSGDFVDQSMYEFSEIVNDTVQGYQNAIISAAFLHCHGNGENRK